MKALIKTCCICLFMLSSYCIWSQQSVEVTLRDGSSYRGVIFEFDELEYKLMVSKRKVVTISKADIISPQRILINPKKFTTLVNLTNDNWYKGEIIIENDSTIMLEIGKEIFKTIRKSDILFRSNKAKKKFFYAETTIYTKDGNELVGEVIGKNHNYTMINVEKQFSPQKIQNENIQLQTEIYKVRMSKFERRILIIGILYLIPTLLAI